MNEGKFRILYSQAVPGTDRQFVEAAVDDDSVTKPTGVFITGSTCVEVLTGIVYMYSEKQEDWVVFGGNS